jgi:O-antigen ligase
VLVAVIYVAWIVMTPFYRFEFLVEWRFERILIACGIAAILLASGERRATIDRIAILVCVFLAISTVSNMLGAYSSYSAVVTWSSEYWKRVVFFLLLIFLIRTRRDLGQFIIGSGSVLAFYLGYSLLDFAAGGSYVFQQGIRRAIGIWSGGGLGSANAFGFLGVLALPFGVFLAKSVEKRSEQVLGYLVILIAFAAILLSGTRAALVCGLLVLALGFRTRFFKASYLIPATVLLVVAWVSIPPDVRDRYISILPSVDTAEVTNEIAESSAKSRIEGLRDGWRLFLSRPILGHGPASSSYARIYVSDYVQFDPNNPRYLQLHNLYGQVLAETGIVGAVTFAALLLAVFGVSNRAGKPKGAPSRPRSRLGELLFLLLIGTFAYGMFSHNLYSYYWLLIFALASIASCQHREWQSANPKAAAIKQADDVGQL